MSDPITKDPKALIFESMTWLDSEFTIDEDGDLCIALGSADDRSRLVLPDSITYLSKDEARQLRDWLNKALSCNCEPPHCVSCTCPIAGPGHG